MQDQFARLCHQPPLPGRLRGRGELLHGALAHQAAQQRDAQAFALGAARTVVGLLGAQVALDFFIRQVAIDVQQRVVQVGTDLILVALATGLIYEVLNGAFD